MTLRPAEPDSGIVFHRIDVPGSAPIPARSDCITNTQLCTTIGNSDGLEVATIEHLMAAFAGCGVDNAAVELDGPEVPAMDGSSAPFVFLLECADFVEQDAPRQYIKLLRPIKVSDGARSATLTPANCFAMSVTIDFDSPAVSRQSYEGILVNGEFKRELSQARTFGFVHDVERMRAMGRALGGSLDNAVVISEDRVLNEEGLRYDNEFVRHKALDSVGDLYLAGAPLLAHFESECSGHQLHHMLLTALFESPEAWCYSLAEGRTISDREYSLASAGS